VTKTFFHLAALAVVAMPMAADASPCRDAKGHFVTCGAPGSKAAPKPKAAPHVAKAAPAAGKVAKVPVKRCKIGGKFASCGVPGAKPV